MNLISALLFLFRHRNDENIVVLCEKNGFISSIKVEFALSRDDVMADAFVLGAFRAIEIINYQKRNNGIRIPPKINMEFEYRPE